LQEIILQELQNKRTNIRNYSWRTKKTTNFIKFIRKAVNNSSRKMLLDFDKWQNSISVSSMHDFNKSSLQENEIVQ
jgi:hypothetical protein